MATLLIMLLQSKYGNSEVPPIYIITVAILGFTLDFVLINKFVR